MIAEAGRQPQEGALQKLAKRAMTMLKGMAAGLSETAGDYAGEGLACVGGDLWFVGGV
ncbi:MAG: hypothetical protein MJA27_31860 [Pseudanabaenales cyanobacterium]|nr:hypothetical protein [Pseudanabaenales cyanobacterium]